MHRSKNSSPVTVFRGAWHRRTDGEWMFLRGEATPVIAGVHLSGAVGLTATHTGQPVKSRICLIVHAIDC
jgi:hypothetical protein